MPFNVANIIQFFLSISHILMALVVEGSWRNKKQYKKEYSINIVYICLVWLLVQLLLRMRNTTFSFTFCNHIVTEERKRFSFCSTLKSIVWDESWKNKNSQTLSLSLLFVHFFYYYEQRYIKRTYWKQSSSTFFFIS